MSTVRHSLLPQSMGGGPKGLGDPDDRSLRKVERDVIIAKMIRDKSKAEKCPSEVKEFRECARTAGVSMVWRCRDQNKIMIDCLGQWFSNEKFREEVTEEYLKERSEYRRTGISKRKGRAERSFTH